MSLPFYKDQVSESKLRELLGCRFEAQDLDYKFCLELTSKRSGIEICKDIIAMANTYGGHIVFGVQDTDFYPVGMPLETYIDSAKLADILDNYIHERIDWLLANHTLEIDGEQRLFAVLYVAPSSIPIVTAKTGAYEDGKGRPKVVFNEGEWLVRSESRSQRASPADVRALLQRRQAPSAAISPTSQHISPNHGLPLIDNLPRPNFFNFVGREDEIHRIMETLNHPRAWTISIDGIGGVGKTALAQKVALDIRNQAFRTGQSFWKFIIWMSAKETVLGVGGQIERVEPGFRNFDEMLDIILDVTGFMSASLIDRESKLEETMEVLSAFPCLLIVDNLETITDETVEHFIIEHLPSPSKSIITSRHRADQKGGLTINLKGMTNKKAIEFLREAASMQGSIAIASASDSKLTEIVELTGGIPLALKLVVGQTALGVNLNSVIERLKDKNAPILDFCFAETYRNLSPESKKVLGTIALFDYYPTLEEIAMVAHLSYGQLDHCVETLVRLSLVSEEFDDTRDEQVYFLLRLTKIFADNQAKSLPDFYDEARQRLAAYLLRKQQLLKDKINPESLRKAKAKTVLEQMAVGVADLAEDEYQANHYDEALRLIKEAAILAPRLSYVQQTWAYIERRKNHYREAREHYRQAIDLDPSSIETYRYWASLESQLREFDEAIRLNREVLLRDSGDIQAKQGLAYTLLRSARQLRRDRKIPEAKEQLEEALDIINIVINSYPNVDEDEYVNFWWAKAQILNELNRPRQALDACDNGLKVKYDSRLSELADDLSKKLGYH